MTQGKLSLGFRTGGSCLTGGDPAAYWMFQTIYGGSTSSKLFVNVREKHSLCYYASAQFIASKGIMQVNSGIENRDFATARDEILRQLDACRQGDITEPELESSPKNPGDQLARHAGRPARARALLARPRRRPVR